MTFHGRRRALRAGVVAATALALAGAATGAVLESRLDDNVISACRNKSTGVLKVPAAGVACGGNEQPLQWNVRPAGPPGRGTGRRSRTAGPMAAGLVLAAAHRAHARARPSPGCRACWSSEPKPAASSPSPAFPAPPSEAPPNVVLNEIDYDQVGADAGGFVELYNAGLSAAELDGLALVFVDGADGARVPAQALERLARPRCVPRRPGRSPERLPRRGRALRHGAPGRRRRALVRRGDRARVHRGVRPHARRGQPAAGGRRRLEHGHRIAGADPERQRHE